MTRYTKERITFALRQAEAGTPVSEICQSRVGRPEAEATNDCRAMGFMPDRLFDERSLRILTITDRHARTGFHA